jgi:hypothetical protein
MGPLEQLDNLGRFAALAGCGTLGAVCPFAELVVGRNMRSLWRTARGKTLDSLPDSRDGCLPARELFDGFLAGQRVPDFNQPGARPVPTRRPSSLGLLNRSACGLSSASLVEAKAVMLF